MTPQVLITDMHHASDAVERGILEDAGFTLAHAMCRSEDELIDRGRGVAAFLVSYAPVSERVLEALPDLKVVVKYGVGVDNIDRTAAARRGVVTANVPDAYSEEVAVHSLGLLLSGFRGIDRFSREVRGGVWNGDPSPWLPRRLSESRFGLLGFGRIARRLASLAAPLFGETVAFDPFVDAETVRRSGCLPVASVDELIAMSDAVSLHVPMTGETVGMVGDAQLQRAKRLIMVNTCRAVVVDRDALVDALDEDRVAFYGADVFWTEPPDMSDPTVRRLLAHPAVAVTPHSGWCSQPSERQMRRLAAEEVVRVLRGDPPRCPVGPAD